MSSGFVSLLKAAGAKLKDFFSKVLPEAATLAKDAEPIIDLAFPGISILFNATVSAVATAEAAGQAAATASTGSNGEQKLAAVLSAVGPLITAYLAQQGITASTAQVTAWVNAIVLALNALPAATTIAPASTSTSTDVGSSVVTTSVSN